MHFFGKCHLGVENTLYITNFGRTEAWKKRYIWKSYCKNEKKLKNIWGLLRFWGYEAPKNPV